MEIPSTENYFILYKFTEIYETRKILLEDFFIMNYTLVKK